ARSQRKPADTGTDGNAHSRRANPRDQRGGIHRPYVAGTRYPAPGIAVGHPTAVMKRRESPARIIDPGPAPRIDPHPMPKPVRGPAHGKRGRRPHVPVVRGVFPASVVVQIGIAGRLRRYVLLLLSRGALYLPISRE